MRVLRDGMFGEDVRQWQQFLVGQGFLHSPANGTYDPDTKHATVDFQRNHNLKSIDGWVGPETMGTAMQLGYGVMEDDSGIEDGPGWPSRPNFNPLNAQDRESIFGHFAFVPAPIPSCPEAIRITDGWAQNIVEVDLPMLVGVQGAPANGRVEFHQKAAQQLVDLFQAWGNAGLLPLVKSWAGSWAPRYIRGSRVYLSNHAWATAFDINAGWNMLGCQPALKGRPGSVRELVQIAADNGFYWGGWFKGRPDGMHFEVAFVQ